MATQNSKVVLITGAGRGIGAAVARRLHNEGAKLLLTDVDCAALPALAGDRVQTVR